MILSFSSNENQEFQELPEKIILKDLSKKPPNNKENTKLESFSK